MSLTTLKQLLKKDKRRHWVIYCEKIWLHPEDLRASSSGKTTAAFDQCSCLSG